MRGWSITELAERAQVSRPTIYGWRDNLTRPRAEQVGAVADALGIARSRAVTLAGYPPPPGDSDDARLIMRSLGRDYDDDEAAQILARFEEAIRQRERDGDDA